MRIVFFAVNSIGQYSGGRYHSWIMAEALAKAGHEVFYLTNNKPIFYDDFKSFPSHKKVKLILSDFLVGLPRGRIDLVVLIPHLTRDPRFFLKTLRYAILKHAAIILLNFETPNWFNLLSPFKKNPALWGNWKRYSNHMSLILSSAEEGNKFAKEYFNKCRRQNTSYDYCYPSINSIIADSISVITKERRIIIITRFVSGEHKGALSITEIISEDIRGYVLVLLVGHGEVPDEIKTAICQKAQKCGVEIEIKYKLTEKEKFSEIKRSVLMLFPSYFEGFGYPPIEAQYCNVPCIVFDLPVLREVSGDNLHYVPLGDWVVFRKKIAEVLSKKKNYDNLSQDIAGVAKFENYTKKISQIVEKVENINISYLSKRKQILALSNIYSQLIFVTFIRYVINVLQRLIEILRAGWRLSKACWKLLKAVLIHPCFVFLRLCLRPIIVWILKKLYPGKGDIKIKDIVGSYFHKRNNCQAKNKEQVFK